MIIVDSHEDLAWNIKSFGRNYNLPAKETRQREQGSSIPLWNGDTLLGWPDYQRGKVALVFGTLYAAPRRAQVGPWDTEIYDDMRQANRLYHGQLDAYHRLMDEHPDRFRLVGSRKALRHLLSLWEAAQVGLQPGEYTFQDDDLAERGWKAAENQDSTGQTRPDQSRLPVGLVPLMEGAEGVLGIEELQVWWERGVRIIGPAWTGTRFCGGTREPGPLTSEGFALLEGMAETGFALDISHMDEKAVLQALDSYPGVIMASHSNALRLLKGVETNRHLSDLVIRKLLERDGVIGVVPFNHFLLPGWTISDGRDKVSLNHLVNHIDTICQLAGDARHVGIGTDFDGGFGWQSVPNEIDTIADLSKLIPLLGERGYSDEDTAMILGQNWISLLERFFPED